MNSELGVEGIKSTALCPAFVDTPMTDYVKEHVKPEDMIRPEDIAEAVRYLLKVSPACIVPEMMFIRPGDPSEGAPPRVRPVGSCAMKLGVHIGYWGLGLSSADQFAIVQEAERLGYDSIWAAEAYGSDAATVLGWLAGQTTTIRSPPASFRCPPAPPR